MNADVAFEIIGVFLLCLWFFQVLKSSISRPGIYEAFVSFSKSVADVPWWGYDVVTNLLM